MKLKMYVYKIGEKEQVEKSVKNVEGNFGTVTHNKGKTEIIDGLEVHEYG